MNLQDAIRQIIDDNSGGIKCTALFTELISMVCENKIFGFSNKSLPDENELLDIIRGLPNVKILEYSWYKMSPPRSKMFIYTP